MSYGIYGMACWNGLSPYQQARLIAIGNLRLGTRPLGWCHNPAAVGIETEGDAAPGPRFFCFGCAIAYLKAVHDGRDRLPDLNPAEQAQLRAELNNMKNPLGAFSPEIAERENAAGRHLPVGFVDAGYVCNACAAEATTDQEG